MRRLKAKREEMKQIAELPAAPRVCEERCTKAPDAESKITNFNAIFRLSVQTPGRSKKCVLQKLEM